MWPLKATLLEHRSLNVFPCVPVLSASESVSTRILKWPLCKDEQFRCREKRLVCLSHAMQMQAFPLLCLT